jgi:hypothetical protein
LNKAALFPPTEGQPTESAVKYHERVQGRADRNWQQIVALVGERAADHLAGSGLPASAAAIYEWAADQQERQQADHGQKQDQQEPR